LRPRQAAAEIDGQQVWISTHRLESCTVHHQVECIVASVGYHAWLPSTGCGEDLWSSLIQVDSSEWNTEAFSQPLPLLSLAKRAVGDLAESAVSDSSPRPEPVGDLTHDRAIRIVDAGEGDDPVRIGWWRLVDDGTIGPTPLG